MHQFFISFPSPEENSPSLNSILFWGSSVLRPSHLWDWFNPFWEPHALLLILTWSLWLSFSLDSYKTKMQSLVCSFNFFFSAAASFSIFTTYFLGFIFYFLSLKLDTFPQAFHFIPSSLLSCWPRTPIIHSLIPSSPFFKDFPPTIITPSFLQKEYPFPLTIITSSYSSKRDILPSNNNQTNEKQATIEQDIFC